MTPTPQPEEDLPDDPDLVAYLDGELDADDSRTIESKSRFDLYRSHGYQPHRRLLGSREFAIRTRAAAYQ